MATVTQFPTANQADGTAWTTPNNAHANDGSYATCAPAKNATVASRWKTFGFDAVIPVGAAITSVTVNAEYKVSVTTSIITFGFQCYVGGAAKGSEYTDTTEPATDTLRSRAETGWTPTRADLLDAAFMVRARGSRGNVTTAATLSLDYISVTVVYTVPAVVTVPTGTASGAGVVPASKGRGKITAPVGTAAGVGVSPTVYAATGAQAAIVTNPVAAGSGTAPTQAARGRGRGASQAGAGAGVGVQAAPKGRAKATHSSGAGQGRGTAPDLRGKAKTDAPSAHGHANGSAPAARGSAPRVEPPKAVSPQGGRPKGKGRGGKAKGGAMQVRQTRARGKKKDEDKPKAPISIVKKAPPKAIPKPAPKPVVKKPDVRKPPPKAAKKR